MDFDSYTTPDAEELLLSAKDRRERASRAQRLCRTEAVGAATFLVGASLLAVLAHASRSLSPVALAVTVVSYLVAARVVFPVGSAWTRPTQVAFVPMLFVLPLPWVPLIVAGCLLLDLWPQAIKRDLSVFLVLGRLGDSMFALGPALVLVLMHDQRFDWVQWPVYVLAFVAQIVCDLGSGLGRTWFAERILPSQQLQMAWLYVTDACLTCGGLLVASSASSRPGIVLLALPLFALLGLFARERQERMDHTLALSTAYRGTALLLGDVIEQDDEYTGIHSREVVDLSLAVAARLGLDATARRNVEFGALLHDVGKIRVPNAIIQKPDKLDEDEWAIMRQHTVYGEQMLRQVGGTLSSVGQVVRSSHERYDGNGYPDGLAGEQIRIESRIVAACDAFNAMTTNRSYRPAMQLSEATAELRRCSGTQFDPQVIAALLRELEDRPAELAVPIAVEPPADVPTTVA